ncbi:hypothetical protein NMY22_g305 [Coprinellus aureogranulatus]|nr:hypothetical protein NMY22_g305 [Coprinellus aureogranulatus]
MYDSQTLTSPLQFLAIGVGVWAFWRLFRRFVVRDPLDNIPGPPPESWLAGQFHFLSFVPSVHFADGGQDICHGSSTPKDWNTRTTFSRHTADCSGSADYSRCFAFSFTCLPTKQTDVGGVKQNMLVVSDPKALHNILIKETDIYEETDDAVRTTTRTWGKGLLSTTGEHHRKQRKMLNPVFSAAHMRDMSEPSSILAPNAYLSPYHPAPIFYNVVHKLESSIAHLVGNEEREIDLLSWMTRTALELVARSGLGYTFDTLEPDAKEHPYAASIRDYIRTINDPLLTIARMLIFSYVHNIGSPRFQRAVANLIPWKKLHALMDMVDIMNTTSVAVFENAKRGLEKGGDASESVAKGKDIMSALIKANMSASKEDRLPDDELIAQVSTLTFAAMDTTSNAMSRILHLLSENPDVQDKLRQEVTEAYASRGGDLDYEGLSALSFLDAICRESLRVYTPGPFVVRQAKKDAILPLATPITTTDGRKITEVPIAKDTLIFVSLHSCNRDPLIWGSDAEEWKPERWLDPLPSSVTDARVPGVYSNLMTFLGGGRSCIGFKFSQLEMKIVLSILVRRFKFAPSGKKIVWLAHGIQQPTVEESGVKGGASEEAQLQLPLKVRLSDV